MGTKLNDNQVQLTSDLAATTGSSLVGFVASGSGASPQTSQGKLRQIVSSLDFGAKWDGTTNDAAAIQAAIDAAAAIGGEVTNPAGTANLGTTSLTIPTALDFGGVSKRATVFLYTGSGSGIKSKTPTTARLFGVNLHDFTIQNSGKPAGSIGLDFTGIDSSAIQRVRSVGFDTGVLYGGYQSGAGGYRNRAFDNEFVGNNSGVVVINVSNELLLAGNEISNNTNFGLDVQSGNSVTSLHNDYESNGTHVRTADAETRVMFGRMEAATNFRYMTTATATNFKIWGVITASGAPVQDLGKFTTDDTIGRNAIRGVNMIRNGGVEAWSSGITSAPDGWSLSQCTVAQDGSAGNFQEGQFAALCTATATSGVMFQDIALPVFQQDTRHAFVVACRVKLGTSLQAAVSLGAQDGSNIGLQSQINMTIASGKSLVTTAGWQTVFGICYPTSNTPTNHIRVALQPDTLNGTGTAWFDAVCVMALDGPTDEFYSGVGEVFPLVKNTYTRTATLNFPSTSANTSSDLTVTVPGATVNNDIALVNPAAASVPAGGNFSAWVSATDTVTVRYSNNTTGALDPASGTFRVMVIHF